MTDSQRRTLEQERAGFAYQAAKDSSSVKNYGSYVKKVASMVQANGLGNTVAFVFAKRNKEDGYKQIYQQLTCWLAKKCWITKDYFGDPDLKNFQLMEALVQRDSDEYRAITLEVLALMRWMRRFADALSEDGNKIPPPNSQASEETENESRGREDLRDAFA